MPTTMQSQTMTRALAAGAVLIAAGLVLLLTRAPSDELALTIPSTAPATRAAEATTARADVEPAPSLRVTPAAAKQRELEAMSETFRNTTFLIAIRDAGFVCNELLRVYGGLDDSAKWMATCSEMLSYTVSVADSGSLRVDPMLQYFDGVLQRIDFQQSSDPIRLPSSRPLRDSLPPEAR